MAQTNLALFIFSVAVIALIAFFGRKQFIIFLILVFVYLIPRAGFLVGGAWYNYPFPIGYALVGFLALKWFFWVLFEKGRSRRPSPLDRIFLAYLVISLLALLIGLINNGYVPNMLVEFSIYFMAFLIFFMMLDMFEDEKSIRVFTNGILICGFMVSLYGVLLLFFGKGFLVEYITYNSTNYKALLGQFIAAKRTISSYGDPNVLSSQLMVFCSIFASILLKGDNRFLKKAFLLLSLILTIVCIYFASSRASLIGLFVLSIILAVTKIKRLQFYVPVFAVSYFIFIEPIRRYYEHRIFSTGITSDLRITYFKIFVDMFMRYPFGVGFGNSIDKNYSLIPAGSIWESFNSFYLNIFSRIGIQGVITFSLILLIMVRYLVKQSNSISDTNMRYFVFGAACGVVIQQFNFMSNNVYHVPGGMLNFWIMCGMLVAIINRYGSAKTSLP